MKQLIVEVCVGTSCHLLGAQDLLKTLEELPCKKKERLDIRGVTCLKACGRGPNVRINGLVFVSVTPDHLMELLSEYFLPEEELQYVASD